MQSTPHLTAEALVEHIQAAAEYQTMHRDEPDAFERYLISALRAYQDGYLAVPIRWAVSAISHNVYELQVAA